MKHFVQYFISNAVAYEIYCNLQEVDKAQLAQLKLLQLASLIDKLSHSTLGTRMWQIFHSEPNWKQSIELLITNTSSIETTAAG